MTRSPSPSRPRSASQAQKYMASRAGSPSRTRLSSSSSSSSSPSSHGSPEQQEKQRKRDLLKDSAGLLLGIGVAAVVAHKVLPKDKDADPVHDNTQDWARDRHRHRDRDANGRTYRERRTDGEHAPKEKPNGNSSGSLLVQRAEKSPHGGHPSGDIGTGRRAPIRGQDLECSALKREDGGLLRLGGKRGACESPRRTYPDVELVAVRTITTAPALALAPARELKREEQMRERGIPGHRSAERHRVHQRSRVEVLACPRDQIRGMEAQQQQQQQRGERHGRPTTNR
ncbi:hypothetical protein E4U32_002780 [Claviceps aff. humidiphila group G2b]|nr:hypothetical protein E4U32_002780 [Claviceps aff. humidiphila group G2b]